MSMSLPVPALGRALPTIIQGGMGVAVSSWRLASAVARRGQLGVVSGTALDLVLTRRLEDGDLDGSVRRAMAAFPVRAIVERVLADGSCQGRQVRGRRDVEPDHRRHDGQPTGDRLRQPLLAAERREDHLRALLLGEPGDTEIGTET